MFEGARLVNGDASVIENSAFVVQGNRIVAVGRRGDVQVPAGAARVDLTGKTVIPALIDAHSHIGYMRNLTSGPQNYTRENILDHMHQFAYFGVAASMAMGSDFGELPFQLRDETRAGKHPHAARFLTAGRGLAPIDEIKPNNMRHSAHLVTTEDDARRAVQELSANGVEMVKTWVDTRGGTIKKLTPPLYEAIIDEAHKRKMRVVVHATGLVDVKALMRAGMDGFAHMVNDVDDELMELLKAKPDTFFMLALGGLRRQMYAPWIDPPHPLVSDSVWPEQIKRLRDRLAKPAPFANQIMDPAVARHRAVCGGRRADRRRHRRRRTAGRPVHRLDHAHRAREHGGGRDDAGAGAGRGDADVGRDSQARRAWHGCAGQERRLRRARCQPAGRHHQHAADRRRLPAGQEVPRAAMPSKWQAEFRRAASLQ